MASELAQPCHRAEQNRALAIRWGELVASQRMLPEICVRRGEIRRQLESDEVFELRRQFRSNLGLGSPEQQRAHEAKQDLTTNRPPLRISPPDDAPVSWPGEHSWVEELYERPEFSEVVFERRSAEREPIGPEESAGCARGL